MRSTVGHIFQDSPGVLGWWCAVAVAALALLVIQHHVVAGFGSLEIKRRVRLATATLAILAFSAVIAPSGAAQQSGAQQSGAPLPDLISDPPKPSFFKELNDADGSTRLVVTFDGYIHNIGSGALDVEGNPQVEGGMQQRVNTDGTWESVGAPTVRFETDDGHNHFHLIEVVEYVLWNELQGLQSAVGSKVGFCLVDSEQQEVGVDQGYSEDGNRFCEEDNPEATELRMGISPGWRDVYDASTTLQWVDVSTVAPGRYWIGAITDPNDEILESNEDNNDLIFSEETISVPGHSPRAQNVVIEGSSETAGITLRSSAHGTVGRPVYVVEEGPTSGVLNVPIGVDLTSPTFTYQPDFGFTGTDRIVFSVHDASSPYPLVAPLQEIRIDVQAASSESSGELGPPPSLEMPSTFFETTVGQPSQVQVTALQSSGDPARVFATGLPAGLVTDSETGLISGVALEEGIFEVDVVALGASPTDRNTLTVNWIVNPADASPRVVALEARSTPQDELVRLTLAKDALGLELIVSGLPPGITQEDGRFSASGRPTDVGEFDVEVQLIDNGEVVSESSFTWTVRPTVKIGFPL